MQVSEELLREVAEGNGTVGERIQEAVSGVAEERARLTALRAQVAALVSQIDGEIGKCTRILKAAGLVEVQSRQQRRRRPEVGEDTAETVLTAVAAMPDGATAVELAEATGFNKSTVRNAIAALRADNRIRAAGKRKARYGVPPEAYKVMGDSNGKS